MRYSSCSSMIFAILISVDTLEENILGISNALQMVMPQLHIFC